MFHTLYARLAAVLVVLFVAIGLAYAVISGSVAQRYLQELTQHFNRDLARRILVDARLVVDGRLDEQALKETFSAYMEINPSIEIYLLDGGGHILSYSADPGRVKRKRVDLAPIRAFLRGEGFPLLGDDPRSHDRRKAFSVTPVPATTGEQGYLYVVLRGEEYDSAERAVQESYVLRLSAWALAGSLGFGLLAGLLLFHILTRRLQHLAGAMAEFRRSGFTRYQPLRGVQGSGSDEIERLRGAFDDMARRIVSQLAQLKEQDRLRRELVARVSHDLRTPLAAVHGYLETLRLKGQELDAATRDEYLGIALRQSGNLTRMVSDLFELAHLEAKETQPRCEAFPVAELLQDVMQKFRPRAAQADVLLEASPPPALPLALADVALTERVLDNLIGNAIDHTPAGGRIELSLQVKRGYVAVAVSDSGRGIASADLSRIFDPFCRSGDSGKDRVHAGLGLAIARRIVELQDGRLTVDNRPEGGAIFTFTLPIAPS